MKTCPFCKENILDDAIKCRYCQSMLVSVKGENAGKTDRATYIVDRGFLRYGKFTLAILAIFAFIGVVLFGINLEETYDRVQDTYEKVQETYDKVHATEKEIDGIAETIAKKMDLAEQELVAAQAKLNDTNSKAKELLIEAKQTLDEARQTLAQITEEAKQVAAEVRQTLGKGVPIEIRELPAEVTKKVEVSGAGSTGAPAADSRAEPRESN